MNCNKIHPKMMMRGCRWTQLSWLVLLLSIAIASIPCCLSEEQQQHQEEVGPLEQSDEETTASDDDEETIMKPSMPDPMPLEDEYGLYSVASEAGINDFVEIANNISAHQPDRSNLLLVAVYKPSCAFCQELLRNLGEAKGMMEQQLQELPKDTSEFPYWNPFVLKLPWFLGLNVDDIDDEEADKLESMLSITDVPSLFFVKFGQASGNVTDYWGPIESAKALQSGLWHAISRITPANFDYIVSPHDPESYYLESVPPRFSGLDHVTEYVKRYHFDVQQNSILFGPVETKYDPHYSDEEINTIHHLLGDSDNNNVRDPNFVLAQCRSEHFDTDHYPESYIEFDQLASVLLPVHRLFAVVIPHCEEAHDGTATIFSVNDSTKSLDPQASWRPNETAEGSMSSMHDFIMSALTPSIMWLDRQMTAPVAFRDRVKMHAVIFVDFHYSGLEKSKIAIQNLRRICQEHDRAALQNYGSKNPRYATMSCLVVPSTDFRMMTTFGIDIWSPLDDKTCKDSVDEDNDDDDEKEYHIQKLLPVVIVTDKRSRTLGTKRYRLDSPQNATFMNSFMEGIWDGSVSPEIKSSKTADEMRELPYLNSYGVETVYTRNFSKRVIETNKCTLLLFVSPTCAHSKRVSIMWNHLAELVHFLGWSDWIQVCKMDGTTEEVFVEGMEIKHLPTIYYLKPADERVDLDRPILYDANNILGEAVGTQSDPNDILLWLFSVADNVDETKVLELLEQNDELSDE